MKKVLFLSVMAFMPMLIMAQDIIKLPKPKRSGGVEFLTLLNNRVTNRDFIDKGMTDQQISDMLWVAYGINRPDGRRTVPTASNKQEIDLYVFMKKGVYLWNATDNTLKLVAAGDQRAKTGVQDFVAVADVNIVMVSNLDKMTGKSVEAKKETTSVNSGYISQNLYLYAANAKMGSVARLMFNREELNKILNIKDNQWIVLTQSVGNVK